MAIRVHYRRRNWWIYRFPYQQSWCCLLHSLDEAAKGLDFQTGPHDNQQVTLLEVWLHELLEARGQVFTEEDHIGLDNTTGARSAGGDLVRHDS